MEKRTLRLNLPYGHLGWQPLKPLGSEVTHPPWPPPSVHITKPQLSFTYHTLYKTRYILHTQQPPNTLNCMDIYDACQLMQAKLVDFPRSDLV